MFIRLFISLWRYRGFVFSSVKREFQTKYLNSTLGAAWMILNPLALILVYTVVFSQVMKARLAIVDSPFSYSIYLCSGILTWGLFSEITGRGVSVFLDNANLLKKLSFPRICLPTIVMLSSLLNFAIIFTLFICFLILTSTFPGDVALAFLPVLLIQIIFSIGLGITLGVLNVFFRDVGQFFAIILQFWFWLTPIVYPETVLPESIRHTILTWNPMAPIVKAYQTIFMAGQTPDWTTLITPAITGLLFCLVGLHLFRKHSGEMVDEL